jgi:hypothetical protein
MRCILDGLAQGLQVNSVIQQNVFLLPRAKNFLEVFVHIEMLEIGEETAWKKVHVYTPGSGRQTRMSLTPKAQHRDAFLARAPEFSESESGVWSCQEEGQRVECWSLRQAVDKISELIDSECETTGRFEIVLVGAIESDTVNFLKLLINHSRDELLRKIVGIGDICSCAKHCAVNELESLYRNIASFAQTRPGQLLTFVRDVLQHFKADLTKSTVLLHPLRSSYPNFLLYNSKIDIFRDHCGEVVVNNDVQLSGSPSEVIEVKVIGLLLLSDKEVLNLENYADGDTGINVSESGAVVGRSGIFRLKVAVDGPVTRLPKGLKIGLAKKTVNQWLPKRQHSDESSVMQASGTSSPRKPEVPEKLRRLAETWRGQFQPFKEFPHLPTATYTDKIDIELSRFDSAILYPSFKPILVSYIWHHLEMNKTVPCEPGETFVVVMAASGAGSYKEFISQLKLDSLRNWDVTYLKWMVLRRFPEVENHLEGGFHLFVNLIQDLLMGKVREVYPTVFEQAPDREAGATEAVFGPEPYKLLLKPNASQHQGHEVRPRPQPEGRSEASLPPATLPQPRPQPEGRREVSLPPATFPHVPDEHLEITDSDLQVSYAEGDASDGAGLEMLDQVPILPKVTNIGLKKINFLLL